MSDTPKLTREQILATFHTYGAPPERWLVGGEFERIIVRGDGRPVFYADPDGIQWLLEQVAARGGWEIKHEGENPIALARGRATITLEPGGQFELSGAPHRSLHALAAEATQERADLLAICEGHDLHPLAVGLTPLARIEAVGWMPKGRYRVMREYLPGELAHYMMKGTASVQCNYDYADEEDCALKVRLAAGVAPLTTAMFANSPLYAGQETGFQSYRGYVWTRTDPARTGFPPGLRDDYTHERWVDYLLSVPMMFYMKDGQWLPARGRTFRSYMEQGIDGHFPTNDDWDLHMTSVFPEVRIKRTIEVRGADCVPLPLALSFCALFSGLFYCANAQSQGLALVEALMAEGDRETRFLSACRGGLGAMLGGRPLAAWAQELVEIARQGLSHCEPEALPLLAPLEELVAEGRSPSVGVLEAWRRSPDPRALIRYLRY